MSKQIPVYNESIYSTKSLASGMVMYDTLRALGDVVYLKKDKVYAVTTYSGLRQVMENPTIFTSSMGVALNKPANEIPEAKASFLMNDGEVAQKRKAFYMNPINRKTIGDITDSIAGASEELVQDLIQRKEFDVVKDFAAYIPLTVVSKLIGFPEKGRGKLLDWAFATFNTMGPNNWRSIKSLPSLIFGLARFARTLKEDTVEPGSWSHATFMAIKEGKLEEDEGRAILMGYAIPSLDTTIQAATSMFRALAKSPEKFATIKANPELIPGVINEVVRMYAPVRGFSRYITEDTELNGYKLEKNNRIVLLLQSANRDESKYPNPNEFDIYRNPKDNLGFGHGTHRCAGEHLAKLELEELLKALCKHVNKLEVNKEEYFLNNTLIGFKSMSGKFSV
jgi:cytochrome P450